MMMSRSIDSTREPDVTTVPQHLARLFLFG